MWRTAVVPATSETEAGETKTIGNETLTGEHSEVRFHGGGGGEGGMVAQILSLVYSGHRIASSSRPACGAM